MSKFATNLWSNQIILNKLQDVLQIRYLDQFNNLKWNVFFLYSWFRKKHPRTLEYVHFSPQPDEYRSMTVVPYLEVLHNSFQDEEDESYQGI